MEEIEENLSSFIENAEQNFPLSSPCSLQLSSTTPLLQDVSVGPGSSQINIASDEPPTKRSKTTSMRLQNNTVEPDQEGRGITASLETDSILGKNGFDWKRKFENISTSKHRAKNVVHIRSGPVGDARLATQPIDCFKLFFNQKMLNEVLTYTNEEIYKESCYYSKQNGNIRATCMEELNALFGLYILAAALKDNHLTSNIMFNTSYSSNRYRATMSRRRFNFLTNCLRFDNKETRDDRKKEDKLAAISKIWNILLQQCRTNYKLGSYLTIDVQLVGFRGNCPFRMYIPSKPNRYGLKIVMMCDNSTHYMIDAVPYVGKGTVPPNISAADFFVTKLIATVEGSYRNITMDNWFTSVPLVEKLLEEKKLTVVGTIKANKPHFPKVFSDLRYQNRNIGSSMFMFHNEITAVSYKEKSTKMVLLLSTMHDGTAIRESTGKPEIIMTYNATKAGVDSFDQLCQNMNCSRKTKKMANVHVL